MADLIVDGVHGCTEESNYVKPTDSLVKQNLEKFKDKKLGLMMHWSPATQVGMDSWVMIDKEDWTQTEINWTDDMDQFRREYNNLYKTFNPIKFQPQKWAELAKNCGFKYLLFTTKHHDGFCMWDTKTTDYKITNKNCPFSQHKYNDIVKNLFDAFREEDLGIHAYFSKPDWNSPYYWSPKFEWSASGTHRNPNYKIKEYPEIWESFVEYTHSQIKELMSDYGDIDVLWLDGGQVDPDNLGQDIRLGELVKKIRDNYQPGLITADRTVGGKYENFITPEQSLPKNPINVPWESCITLGENFSFKYGDSYKSAREIVQMLINIVAKGGNLALNITPQPDGALPKEGVKVLKELGRFLEINGEAIYKTRVCKPYVVNNYAFTQKNNKVYVFYLYEQGENIKKEFEIPAVFNFKEISFLSDNSKLNYKKTNSSILVETDVRNPGKSPYADVFKITID